MKVFDLQCQYQHLFEGWFGSEADFQTQLQGGLIECPLCGDKTVHKRLSAPRLNLRAQHHRADPARSEQDISLPNDSAVEPSNAASAPVPLAAPSAESLQSLQAAWLKMTRQVMAHTEDVGDQFAAEARRIHDGQAEERGIRGQATPQEARELLDEGIAVLPLALPESVKKTLQ